MTHLQTDTPHTGVSGQGGWIARLVARPSFQRWAAAFPLTRPFVRRDGAALFGLVQGFVQSQSLFALVELRVLHHLMDHGPVLIEDLASRVCVPAERLHLVMQAGAAMGLMRRRRDGRFAIARQGAALIGAPGLEQMILHHRVLYRDLENPSAFLRGETTPELASFWPYVMGATGEADETTSRTYSRLMAESQALVAPETLDAISLKGIRQLLDVGGGSGVFLTAAAARNPSMGIALFDLPPVMHVAAERFAKMGLAERVTQYPGSFKTEPLPGGADAISLIRVLYDHRDSTVRDLLAKCYDTLPDGGRLIISEPMSGGARPDPITDVYFAMYTAAMGTGRTRSVEEICKLCREAGFRNLQNPRTARSFVTSVITAVR